MAPRPFRSFPMLLTGLCILATVSQAQEAKPFTRAELMQDARQLASILEQSHPDPYINGGGKIAFHRKLQNILQAIPADGMTAEEFRGLILPFVASLRDGHTAILPAQTGDAPRPGLTVPFRIIDESLAVSDPVRKDNVDLYGARLLAVEGVPLQELIQRQNNLRGVENVYGTLALMSRSFLTTRGLQLLIPERVESSGIRLTLLPANGKSRDFVFQPGEEMESSPTQPASKVRLPDMSRSDVAWSFLDDKGKTALLKIDDMSGYREGCEAWIGRGMSEGPDMARAAYQKFHGTEAPEKIEDVLAGIPSATDVFTDLAIAMKRSGTQNLIVDLRRNTGGNDLMANILLYFLFGREAMASCGQGYQIIKYSDLYFQVYTDDSLPRINSGRAQPLEIGDYDFAEENAFANGRDPAASLKAAEEYVSFAPTFSKVYGQGTYEKYYRPSRIVVLCSAWTYSSGFTMLAALQQFGAAVVGTTPAYVGNTFTDSLLFRLKNTQLVGAVSFKKNITFPEDPDTERSLKPDVVLTYEKWASLDFDPDAEVLLALAFLAGSK
jgi:hypothetical protein